MNIEEVVRAWKADENAAAITTYDNPAGNELSEQQLLEVVGGLACEVLSCGGAVSCLLIESASYTSTTY
ncbi:hypothetical protein KDAU_32950 [Dictyobacter aurantiacus]|uniref:Mersacidin/lichenicidin family type 2 lantibiotic n=1 Tax=Dictyobacter aurantiacus TaxID=1936993 RepID=A0A401ZGJ3_9CHLR|nr:hypothetical protein KDAU_32950 [Dictyobacter aurantiacus]